MLDLILIEIKIGLVCNLGEVDLRFQLLMSYGVLMKFFIDCNN